MAQASIKAGRTARPMPLGDGPGGDVDRVLGREPISRALAEQHRVGIAGHGPVERRDDVGQLVLAHVLAPRPHVVGVGLKARRSPTPRAMWRR